QPHRLAAVRRRQLRRIAEDHDLVITGLHWLLLVPEGLSITGRDESVRLRTLDVMRRLIELCHDLGGGYLVHGSPKQRPVDPNEARETALGRAGDAFAAIAGDAEAAGVAYLIEPLARTETQIVNTVEEAVEIVQRIGSPAVRTMIDVSAAANTEDAAVPALVERWLPEGLIGHVHLNDPNRRAPGQGTLRFGPILDALRRLDYAGWCGVEPFVYEPDGPTSAARAIGYLRGLLEAEPPPAT
ncbi:MAG TPA: sugar phosphate isomerase/epimerase family protein, partial [Geminicoccaceae bacterium]